MAKAFVKASRHCWALPLYVQHLDYPAYTPDGVKRVVHLVQVRVLCVGFFFEWSR